MIFIDDVSTASQFIFLKSDFKFFDDASRHPADNAYSARRYADALLHDTESLRSAESYYFKCNTTMNRGIKHTYDHMHCRALQPTDVTITRTVRKSIFGFRRWHPCKKRAQHHDGVSSRDVLPRTDTADHGQSRKHTAVSTVSSHNAVSEIVVGCIYSSICNSGSSVKAGHGLPPVTAGISSSTIHTIIVKNKSHPYCTTLLYNCEIQFNHFNNEYPNFDQPFSSWTAASPS